MAAGEAGSRLLLDDDMKDKDFFPPAKRMGPPASRDTRAQRTMPKPFFHVSKFDCFANKLCNVLKIASLQAFGVLSNFRSQNKMGSHQPDLSAFFTGLEERLSQTLARDRQDILGAIAGGMTPGAGAGSGGPIVLLPDEPLDTEPCQTCGRSFEPIRMAIHQRGCARLQQPIASNAAAAQQRFDAVRQKAWAQLAALSAEPPYVPQQQHPPAAVQRPRPMPPLSRQSTAPGHMAGAGPVERTSAPAPAPAPALPAQAGRNTPPAGGARTPPRGRAPAAAPAQPPSRPAARSPSPAMHPPPPVHVPTDYSRRTGSPDHDPEDDTAYIGDGGYDDDEAASVAPSYPASEAAWDGDNGLCEEVAPDPDEGVGDEWPPEPASSYPETYDDEAPQDEGEAKDTAPCDICGRNFVVDRLERHVKICSKSAGKKRKVFGASAERLKLQEKASAEEAKKAQAKADKKAVWKAQHEAFQNALKSANAISKGEAPPADLHEVRASPNLPSPHISPYLPFSL